MHDNLIFLEASGALEKVGSRCGLVQFLLFLAGSAAGRGASAVAAIKAEALGIFAIHGRGLGG